uniref:Molybdopterin synthase catalytic subunit n=1 Tax=Caldisericum exile TaxID=693075 RepID=A0A7C4Y5N9_9BACT
MVKLTKEKIDETSLTEALKSETCGSILVFLGEPRRSIEDGNVTSIEYTAYKEMALKELERIEKQALKHKGILNVIIVHRLGAVPLKETSLYVGVASRHREEGFEVMRWVIDEIKRIVPIWKEVKYDRDRHS